MITIIMTGCHMTPCHYYEGRIQMPKTTFYNLPPEKKKRIFEAARKEFSRVPYNKASINQIIQDANISRGSFYTYFEDKKDLVQYMMDEYATKLVIQGKKTLENSNGDIFATFTDLFNFTLEYSIVRDAMSMFKNIFVGMHTSGDFAISETFNFRNEMEDIKALISNINTENLCVDNKEELKDLLEILICIMKFSILHAPTTSENLPQAKAHFLNKINIIKYGILKERN
ncbi:MAG: TetR/AcrR family transcriptional regulator [Tissierellaceae bacterium]|nr:TetR/AcrR family transcriptional regulator [Tissierellaceae bacterium]